jgi:hypothetical protein
MKIKYANYHREKFSSLAGSLQGHLLDLLYFSTDQKNAKRRTK